MTESTLLENTYHIKNRVTVICGLLYSVDIRLEDIFLWIPTCVKRLCVKGAFKYQLTPSREGGQGCEVFFKLSKTGCIYCLSKKGVRW